jgi:thiol:disulfide interchange protein
MLIHGFPFPLLALVPCRDVCTAGIALRLPCNAAAIAVLLALASTTSGLTAGLGSFLCFGLGMTFPLIIIANRSELQKRQFKGFLQRNQKRIRQVSGLVMLGISVWHLYSWYSRGGFLKSSDRPFAF